MYIFYHHIRTEQMLDSFRYLSVNEMTSYHEVGLQE